LSEGDPAQASLRLDEMEPLARYEEARVHAGVYRGTQWLEQGDLTRAFAKLQQVSRSELSRGFELRLLGEILFAQGQLDNARARFEQFLARGWPADADARVLGMLGLCRLEVAGGQLGRAEALAREAIAICVRSNNETSGVTSQSVLAGVLVAERRFDEARVTAESALRGADAIELTQEWIDARIALARARFGLHPADIDAALGDAEAALARARDRGLLGQAYEARLAAAEIAVQGGRPAARAQLRSLAEDADQHGFGLVVRRARAAAAEPR
jgi:tetratricopeptide (TPR) repeat protein